MRKLLAIMEALYERQALDGEADLRNLTNLYLLQQTPAKAARLLEREMASGRLPRNAANWQLVGEAWVQAREPRRAIEPLGRALAAGGEAEIAPRLARLHLDLEEWDAAASVLETALARGGLQRPDGAPDARHRRVQPRGTCGGPPGVPGRARGWTFGRRRGTLARLPRRGGTPQALARSQCRFGRHGFLKVRLVGRSLGD
jgi:hypothetical protein